MTVGDASFDVGRLHFLLPPNFFKGLTELPLRDLEGISALIGLIALEPVLLYSVRTQLLHIRSVFSKDYGVSHSFRVSYNAPSRKS